jgi:hypothetical protein
VHQFSGAIGVQVKAGRYRASASRKLARVLPTSATVDISGRSSTGRIDRGSTGCPPRAARRSASSIVASALNVTRPASPNRSAPNYLGAQGIPIGDDYACACSTATASAVMRIRYTEPSSSAPATVSKLGDYRDL